MRTKRVCMRSLALGILIASFMLLLAAPAAAVTHSDDELSLSVFINDYREKHGLQRLLISDPCTDAAKKHASDMAKYGFTGHTTVQSDWFAVGSLAAARMAACGYDYVTSTGEICGYGAPFTPSIVFEGWCGSPAHNAQMLVADYKVMGLALVLGGSYGHYWVVDFGGYVDPTAHEPFPAAPTNLVPTPGDGHVLLAWNAVPGAGGYNVYRDGVKVNATPVTQTSYLDTGNNGVAFSYQVTAIVCGKETAKSITVAATPQAGSGGSGTPAFLDVPATHPYFRAIQQMAEAQIIDGYTVTGGREFRPDAAVKRAQFAKMIVGALKLAVSEDLTSPFTDLGADDPASLYPHEYVAAAFRDGIIKGTSATTFAPWDSVKRSQVVTMVVRALQNLYPGALAIPPTTYTNTWGVTYDAEQGPLARIAEHNGLLDGLPLTGVAADPWGAASRGEVAQVLWNVMQQMGSD